MADRSNDGSNAAPGPAAPLAATTTESASFSDRVRNAAKKAGMPAALADALAETLTPGDQVRARVVDLDMSLELMAAAGLNHSDRLEIGALIVRAGLNNLDVRGLMTCGRSCTAWRLAVLPSLYSPKAKAN